jgi:hypothetical protein
VTPWSDVFLGIIALATVVIAGGLVAMLVAAGRLARRLVTLLDRVDSEAGPLFGHLNAIGRDASRAAALAVAQVERFDRLFADAAQRVDDTLRTVHDTVTGPAREGRAILSGLAVALRVLRDIRAGRRHADDEDALFI